MAVPAAKYTAQVSFLTVPEQKTFIAQEAKRLDVSDAAIWREIAELGMAAYKEKVGESASV